jgi:DNA ligase-1
MSDTSEDESARILSSSNRRRQNASKARVISDDDDTDVEKLSQNPAVKSSQQDASEKRAQSTEDEHKDNDTEKAEEKPVAAKKTAAPKKAAKKKASYDSTPIASTIVVGGGGDVSKNSAAFNSFFNIKKRPATKISDDPVPSPSTSTPSEAAEAVPAEAPAKKQKTEGPNVFASMMSSAKASASKNTPSSQSSDAPAASPASSASPTPSSQQSPPASGAVDIAANFARYFTGNCSPEEEEKYTFGSASFDPVKHALWQAGSPVPYSAIALVFAKCEATTKRLRIISYLRDFFRMVLTLSPQQLIDCVYLCVNQVAPAYEGKELGVGEGMLMKALTEATGSTLDHVRKSLREVGDLGEIAERQRSKQRTLIKPVPLTVPLVFKRFKEISEMSGSKSGDRRKDVIKQLLVSAVGREARFLARALQGNLRIHVALLTVLRALAEAVVLTPPDYADAATIALEDAEEEAANGNDDDDDDDEEEDEEEKETKSGKVRTAQEKRMIWAHKSVEAAYNQGPSLNRLVDVLLKYPLEQVRRRCALVPGLPIKVMLGKPATSVQDVLDKFEDRKITMEYKYDGERAQIHMLPDGTIKIYSRNLEDNTTKYPDVIGFLPSVIGPDVRSFILDAEVVAWDVNEKKILPFQTLSTRKRKDVKNEDVAVQVVLFGFDLLSLNGKSYMRTSYERRREALHEHFKATEGRFYFAKALDTSELADISVFLEQAIADSCEGLMVKPLDHPSFYVPDKRKWIKIKKDYLSGVGDSLDLVCLGAWHGKGKRTGKYGAFLMFCYDDENEEYQSLTKVGTGFSDQDLDELTKLLKDHEIDGPRSYYKYHANTNVPDVWFDPAAVWEILCADLSISPVYQAGAGLVHESKGIATRFPRFIRQRPDKTPEMATNAEQVAEMYNNQSVIKSNSSGRPF